MASLLHSFKIRHLFGIISLLKRGRELYGLKGHITQIRRTFSQPPTQHLKENYLPQKKLYPLPAVLMTNNEYMANISSNQGVASKLLGGGGGVQPPGSQLLRLYGYQFIIDESSPRPWP